MTSSRKIITLILSEFKKLFALLSKFPNEESLRAHLIRGASGSLLLKIFSVGLLFVLSIVLARILGVKGFGIYSFCISVVNLLTMISMLGLQELFVREAAKYQSEGNWSLLKGLIISGTSATVITSILFSAIILIAAISFSEQIDYSKLLTLKISLILIPLLALLTIYGEALRGLGYIIIGQLPKFLLRPVIFLSIISLTYIINVKLNSAVVIAFDAVAVGISLSFALYFFVKKISKHYKSAQYKYNISSWKKSAFSLLLASSLPIINLETSTVMLGILSTAENVGIFQVAQRGALLVFFGLHSVDMAIAPTISNLYSNGDYGKLQKVITKSARASLLFSFPVALFLMISGKWIIPLIFGQEFGIAVVPLIILAFGQLVNTAMGSVGVILNMTKNERLTVKGRFFGILINIGLNIVLIPLWGAIGAAIATSISYIFWNILLSFWIFRRLGIYTTAILPKKGI